MKLTPETVPIQMGHEPALADGVLDTSAWCDLKDCDGVLITVCHFTGADTDVTLDIHEGDTAAGTTRITANAKIWSALNALVDPTMVRRTDALTYIIDAGDNTGSQVVQFYLDAANCKRYIQLGASAGNIASVMSVTYQKSQARYKGHESY